MKQLKFVTLTALLLIFFMGAADAQKRSTRKAPPPPVKTVPPLDVRAAREKVDNQLANVNTFVDRLGPIAQSIEDLDASAKAKPLTKAAADKNAANKQKVIIAIRNLRAGLTDLEAEFRTKTALQKYLPPYKSICRISRE